MNTRKLIMLSGLRDADIAARAEVHRATVGRWRAGTHQPDTAEHIEGLARALGVAPRLIRPDLARIFTLP